VIHAIDAVLIPPGFVPPSTSKDIVDTAVAAGNFKTLVAAVQAAGLVDALKGPGPLTVFAPTDAAFAKLPPGLIDYLLKPENKELLKSVLLYHVVDGNVSSAQAKKLTSAKTLQGGNVHISFNGVDLFINGARVVAADVKASNGVIHAIDTVLVPSLTMAQVLEASGNFKTFLAAVKAAGLEDQLTNSHANATVFAPTDAAFAKLPAGTVDNLLKPENRNQLRALLNYHLGIGRLTAAELGYFKLILTRNGAVVSAKMSNGVLTLNNGASKVVYPDVGAVNGIIHGIDTVLTPPAH
jgi:transforming growth factor-beta-induced protein